MTAAGNGWAATLGTVAACGVPAGHYGEGVDQRPPLWVCPRCGRRFANRNQTHTCGPLGDLDGHFAGGSPVVREIFDRIVAVVSGLGPVEVLPEKTRIALHARMSFAAFVPRRRWLDGHLILARRVDSARFRRIEPYSSGNVLHAFRLTEPAQVDGELAGWLAEAYHRALGGAGRDLAPG